MSWWGSKYQLAKRTGVTIMTTREQVERIVRENVSWQELTTFPELTDHMIDEIERVIDTEVLTRADTIIQRLHPRASIKETN